MSIFRRIIPVIALLAIIFIASAPITQSRPLLENGVRISAPVQKKVLPVTVQKLSDKSLNTNIDPILIRNTVHNAWLSGEFKWSSKSEWTCFDQIIDHESSWHPDADNGMGWEETGGIPQAHPSSKMAEAGKDYRTNVWTQVKWGLNYINSTYGTPCNAWDAWQNRAANDKYGWY
jgi:hypothetical protein